MWQQISDELKEFVTIIFALLPEGIVPIELLDELSIFKMQPASANIAKLPKIRAGSPNRQYNSENNNLDLSNMSAQQSLLKNHSF